MLKSTVHGAFRACNSIYIKIPPANPSYLPSGKKFPTLKRLFEDSLSNSSYDYDIPKLVLWQTDEEKISALPQDSLDSIITQVRAISTRIMS